MKTLIAENRARHWLLHECEILKCRASLKQKDDRRGLPFRACPPRCRLCNLAVVVIQFLRRGYSLRPRWYVNGFGLPAAGDEL